MITKTRILVFSLLLVFSLGLTACSCGSSSKPSNTITGIEWRWESVTDQTTRVKTSVSQPRNYTIAFNTDGTLQGKSDCNTFTGTYSQKGGFFLTIVPATSQYCGANSLDQQYRTLLSSIAAGGPDGAGGLALETSGGALRMEFSNGGKASQ